MAVKPKWLLQADVFDEVSDIVPELERQGYEYKLFDSTQLYDKHFDDNECVIPYCSLEAANFLVTRGWIPGIYRNLTKLKCSYYYPRLQPHLLNRDYMMLPFGELLRQKHFIKNHFGERVFVRPDSCNKIFTGTTCTFTNWEKDIEFLGFYDVQPEELVLVAPYKHIDEEWRMVVVDNKVISGSMYRDSSGERLEPAGNPQIGYVQDVLNNIDYNPDRAWTLDICKSGGMYHVLEVGSFSCAGLYVAPKEPIVREVSRVALEEWNEYRPI